MNGTSRVLTPECSVQGSITRRSEPWYGRAAPLAVVISAHIAVAWILLSDARSHDGVTPFVRVLYARIIETNNPALANGQVAPRVPEPAVLEDLTRHLTLLPGLPPIELAAANDGAVQVAPHLLDGAQPPVEAFARRGGLRAGESAFIVLRLQVMPGGTVADAAIDVSSGSRQVDEAAKAYGRATRWVAGRSGNLEMPTWVRLGVRLAA